MAIPATYSIAGTRSITATSFEPQFISQGDGALPTDFQVAVSTNSSMSGATNTTIQYSGLPVSGLYRNTKYYYRVRGHNSSGYGAWSSIVSFTTLRSVPAPPLPTSIEAPDPVTIHYHYSPNPNDGGAAVIEFQVGYGTDPNTPLNSQSSDSHGDVTIVGVTRNTLYYVWSRARNSLGWSDYSARAQIQTPAYTPISPSPSAAETLSQVSVKYTYVLSDNGGAEILESEVGWSTDQNVIQHSVSNNSGTAIITGLTPATDWYFWSRSRNQSGWGNWSKRLKARTLAGSRVNVGGVWREAIPYVKDGGSWHVARPYVKSVGLWDNTV